MMCVAVYHEEEAKSYQMDRHNTSLIGHQDSESTRTATPVGSLLKGSGQTWEKAEIIRLSLNGVLRLSDLVKICLLLRSLGSSPSKAVKRSHTSNATCYSLESKAFHFRSFDKVIMIVNK
jgi:hypothetical protein